jgi:hypothetical protein
MAVAETATYQQVAWTYAFGCEYDGIPDMNSGDYYAYVPTMTDFDVSIDSCLQTCASSIPVYQANFNSKTWMSNILLIDFPSGGQYYCAWCVFCQY